MPKRNNYYLRQLSGRGEEYTREDYEELIKHEGEFRYSDFKKWNMSKLLRTARVLREEAFRRADEFENAVNTKNIPLSPAYSRLEERNVTWVKNRSRLKFGSTKVEVINNIIQTLTFLDDETSSLEGWKKSIDRLAEKINVPAETLMDRDESNSFFELYYKVTDYLTKNGVNWKPSETFSQLHTVTQEEGIDLNSINEEEIRKISRKVEGRLKGYYERSIEDEIKKTDVSTFFTTKK